ncbi:substrate-binding domain-containing protein [Elioraea sp.]|uniref:substrate-binding domain-containing protein n=1 Tax=Elioraea sp. TaxID=2185103 RepID=UPI0025C3B43B|nr:substrate-binding domain-containing protein [Elioraea sp.]
MDGLVDGILRDVVASFHATHPHIHLSIEVGGTGAGLRALLAGTLDALLASTCRSGVSFACLLHGSCHAAL